MTAVCIGVQPIIPFFEDAAAAQPRALTSETKARKGDFYGMVERRVIRVLAPFSRSLQRGLDRSCSARMICADQDSTRRTMSDQIRTHPVLKVRDRPTAAGRDRPLSGLQMPVCLPSPVARARRVCVCFVSTKPQCSSLVIASQHRSFPALTGVFSSQNLCLHKQVERNGECCATVAMLT